MLEVEVKFKLQNKEVFEENLKQLGANYVVDIIHKDTYYNLPKGMRNFAKTDEALRLRRIEEYDVRETETVAHKISSDLTYKGPKIDTETKTRKELITTVGNPDELDSIIKSLGFRTVLTLAKYRRLYTLDVEGHHIEMLIDKIEHLDGYYAECEIMASSDKEMEESKVIIFDILEKLGYYKTDSILASYLELVIKKLIENGEISEEEFA
ncbi:MAG: class IV adenylate cyclase [Candidatus Lokiarchaeota archaeon]|nr:class IV adenylate cyclase [Candidatus Lokiarchaeota archaeon]